MIRTGRPRYLVTLTHPFEISSETQKAKVSSVLKMVTKEYFGRNRKKDSLAGWVVVESQMNGNLHTHLVINEHRILSDRKKDFEEVFRRKCGALPYFRQVGIDIQDYYEGNLEDYLTKTLEYAPPDRDFIFPITHQGY